MIAILPEYQNLKLGSILFSEGIRRMENYNYKDVVVGWVLEDNYRSLGVVQKLGFDINTTYRIYKKELR